MAENSGRVNRCSYIDDTSNKVADSFTMALFHYHQARRVRCKILVVSLGVFMNSMNINHTLRAIFRNDPL